ncbi:MAG: hypothetical protein N2C12_13325 [Planctomycetales bacterium]
MKEVLPLNIHAIQLRAPWDRILIDGQVCYQRRFNLPTGLAVGDTVWIVIEGQGRQPLISCNDIPIKMAADGEFEVTQTLAANNKLQVTRLENDAVFKSVRLEIRARDTP